MPKVLPLRRGPLSALLGLSLTTGLLFTPTASAMTTWDPTDPAKPGDVAPRIVGGDYEDTPDGAVSLYAPSYGGFSCSASRIAPTWILTARHCAELKPSRAYTNSIYRTNGDYGNVTQIVYAPSGDVALLKLDRSPAGDILPWSNKLPSYGQQMTMRGWGMDSANGTSTTQLKTAQGQFVGTGSNQFYGGQDLLINGITGAPWRGDSGGPVTVNGVLYGACSWSSSYGTNSRAQAGYGALANIASWVQQTTGVAPNGSGGSGGGNTPTPTPTNTSTPAPGGGTIVNVTSSNWSQVVASSYQRPVAVEFGASWCSSCQYLKPRMEAAHRAGGGSWTLAYVDVDSNPSITQQARVSGYPTTYFMWQGKEIPSSRFTGALEQSQIQQYVDYAKRYAAANPGNNPTPTPTPTNTPTSTPTPTPTNTTTSTPTSTPTGDHGALTTLTDQNYDAFVADSRGRTVFLVFSKDGCEPCQALHPLLEKRATELGDKTAFGVMDGTAYPTIWAKYQNPWFPTVIAIRDGKEIARRSGYSNDASAMNAWIDSAMKGSANTDPRVMDVDIYDWPKVEEMSWRHPVIVAYYRSDGYCPRCDYNISRLKKMVANDGGKWTLVTVDVVDPRTYNIWTYFKVRAADTIDTYYRDDLVQNRIEGSVTDQQLKDHINKTLSTHYPPKERS